MGGSRGIPPGDDTPKKESSKQTFFSKSKMQPFLRKSPYTYTNLIFISIICFFFLLAETYSKAMALKNFKEERELLIHFLHPPSSSDEVKLTILQS